MSHIEEGDHKIKAALAVMLALVSWCATPAMAGRSGQTEQRTIVYAARYYHRPPDRRKSFWHIYRIGDEGKDRRQLTRGEADHECPEVSPDGRYVACLRTSGPQRAVLVVRADSGMQLARWVSGGRSDEWIGLGWAADSRSLGITRWGASVRKPDRPTSVLSLASGRTSAPTRGWKPFDRCAMPDGRRLDIRWDGARSFGDVTFALLGRSNKSLAEARVGEMADPDPDWEAMIHTVALGRGRGSTFVVAQNRGHDLASAARNWGLFALDMAAKRLAYLADACAVDVARDGVRYCMVTATGLHPLGNGKQVYASKLMTGRLPGKPARTIVSGLVFVADAQWAERAGVSRALSAHLRGEP